jgi:hypothetical protein
VTDDVDQGIDILLLSHFKKSVYEFDFKEVFDDKQYERCIKNIAVEQAAMYKQHMNYRSV